MGYIPSESEIIGIFGHAGGQQLQTLGTTLKFCNSLLMLAGIKRLQHMQPFWLKFTSTNDTSRRLLFSMWPHKPCKTEVFARHKFSKPALPPTKHPIP